MLNVPADSVILSREEYMVLVESAKAQRQKELTKEEKDAIVYAIRKLTILDAPGKSPDEKIHQLQVLVRVAKKMEGYDA